MISTGIDIRSASPHVSAYPPHSFVIDKMEARTIFINVRDANSTELQLSDALGDLSCVPSQMDQPRMQFLSTEWTDSSHAPDQTNSTGTDSEHPGSLTASAGGDAPVNNSPPALD
jgi:hypothetical protein